MKRHQRGAALLLVIVIIGLLSLLVVEFQRKAHLDAVSAANGQLLLQAHALAHSGVEAAKAALKEDLKQTGQKDDRTEILWYSADPQALPVGEYTISVQIEDQYGKFPINALVGPNGTPIPGRDTVYRDMLDRLDLGNNVNTRELTDALVDWISASNQGTGRYKQNAHFTVPNAPITHQDELSRIEGYDTLQPFQLKAIMNNVDTRIDPSAKINVNTASKELLWALNPGLNETQAETLYTQQGSSPDANQNSARGKITVPNFLADCKSDRFLITVKAEANGVARQVECIVFRDKNGCKPLGWLQY